jgi:hypothetical protein
MLEEFIEVCEDCTDCEVFDCEIEGSVSSNGKHISLTQVWPVKQSFVVSHSIIVGLVGSTSDFPKNAEDCCVCVVKVVSFCAKSSDASSRICFIIEERRI